MIGLSLAKRAAKHGYKRYGIPGAIVAGSATAIGYKAVKRALKSATNGERVESAIDVDAIKSTVEKEGVSAVSDRETLESAIDEDELESAVDIGEIGATVEDETPEDGNGSTDGVDGDESVDEPGNATTATDEE